YLDPSACSFPHCRHDVHGYRRSQRVCALPVRRDRLPLSPMGAGEGLSPTHRASTLYYFCCYCFTHWTLFFSANVTTLCYPVMCSVVLHSTPTENLCVLGLFDLLLCHCYRDPESGVMGVSFEFVRISKASGANIDRKCHQ